MKNKMVNLYPAAIESDEEITVDESGDDENADDVEAITVVKKKKVAGAATEFSADFSFECPVDYNTDQDDSALKKYLRNGVPSTLEDKIAAVRKNKNTAKEVEVEMKNDDDEVEQLGGKEAKDQIRDKKKMGKRSRLKQDDFFEETMNVVDIITFEQMHLSRPILKAIAAVGYSEPTPIQAACIPVALSGKDICACAATGTGKTAAFVLPILERLLYRPSGRLCTRILVLIPTRELAIQVFQVFRKLSTYSQVEVCLCAGGLDLKTQEAALRSGPDVVVATPGRLIDHLHNSPSFSLNNIEVLVLDEADRMLEEAFKDQMNELIRLCAPNRQTLLFSATMTDQIDELASMSLKKPVKIFINENNETALKLRQEFIRIRAGRETDREAIVSGLVTRTFQENTIIFVRMKKDCQRMHILLGLLGLKAGQMHSSLSQAQRIEALSKFKRREIDVLVSTDLASRGLDIEGVQTIINMHMPRTIKQYIHRVGRTARAGRAGRSISLVGEDDRKLLKEIIRTNPDRTLKQRIVAPEVVEAYRQRIDSLEESIRQIDLEEKEEKELRLAEIAMRKTEEKLETGTTEREGRVWFKKATEGERERRRAEKKLLKKEALKRKQEQKTPEQIRLEHEMAFLAREAKRARRRKNQRIRAIVETPSMKKMAVYKKKTMRLSDIRTAEVPQVSTKKVAGRKRKSSFTSALTAVGKKSVKKARHGPEDSAFQKARVAHRLKTKKK